MDSAPPKHVVGRFPEKIWPTPGIRAQMGPKLNATAIAIKIAITRAHLDISTRNCDTGICLAKAISHYLA
jgi:hypothetical protein